MVLAGLHLGSLVQSAWADPSAAEQHYTQALEHLRAGELQQAREAFLLAYRESPHYLVLYNLGLVSLELGDNEGARDYLERYLEQGRDTISAERRAQVEDLIRATRLGTAPASEKTFPSKARSSASLPSETASREVSTRPTAEDAEIRARGGAVSRESQHFEAPAALPPPAPAEQQKIAAFFFGATGAALALTGAGVLIWNQNRYVDYRATRGSLERARPPEDVTTQQELEAWLDHLRAEERNAAALTSIKQFDIVGGTLTGVGAAALATGIVLYVTREDQPSVRVGDRRVMLTFAW